MARYRCVVCNEPEAQNVRYVADRHMRVCDAHVGMSADDLASTARPALKGSKEMYRLRAQLAARMRADPRGDYTELRRDLAFAALASTIERELQNGPSLTSAQIDRLIALLRP